MKNDNGLHLLYKNLGETPNETILRFKKANPEYADIPMTYAGRLDPMAEGLLIVLSLEEIKEKDKFLDMKKTYEFEVLWGFETDTLDVLGKVLKFESLEVNKEEVEIEIKKSIGKLEQKYPAYSSKPVNGKPLFQWAREGKISEIEIPSHEVEIFGGEFLGRRTISKDDLINNIKSKVESVVGDFRQKMILERWVEVLKEGREEFVVDKIQLVVSSGFYVRQFVSDLAKGLGTAAVTFHIKRTLIGEYAIADSIK